MKKSVKLEIIAVVLLAILLILGSYIVLIKAPDTLVNDSYEITNSKIPADFNGFKIGFFSDLCLDDEDDLEILEKTVDKLNQQNYDIVLFGGDLYYDDIFAQERVEELLASIHANYGKFAVLGEKDLVTNTDTTMILTLGEFEVLKDQVIPIYYNDASIALVGLESEINIDTIVPEAYYSSYKLVLVHTPDTYLASNNEDSTNSIDLQLSGHSHGGYVYLPFVDIADKRVGAKTYVHGKYDVNLSSIIVSNGANKEPDVRLRLFCSPDIITVTLKS